jgi:hypothetical protein
MKSEQTFKGWVIRWHWTNERYRVEPNIFHVLPEKTPTKAVASYIQALYLNSERRVLGRLRFLERKKDWCREVVNEGRRLIVGSNPHLVACFTKISVEQSKDRDADIVKWNWVSGLRLNAGSVEELGTDKSIITIVPYDS